MRVDVRHETKARSESLFRSPTPYDNREFRTLGQTRVTRAKLLGPGRIVDVDSPPR